MDNIKSDKCYINLWISWIDKKNKEHLNIKIEKFTIGVLDWIYNCQIIQ